VERSTGLTQRELAKVSAVHLVEALAIRSSHRLAHPCRLEVCLRGAVSASLPLVGQAYEVEAEARSMCLGGWSVSRTFPGHLPARLRGRGAL